MRWPIILFLCLQWAVLAQKKVNYGKDYIKGVSVQASSNGASGIKTLAGTGFIPNHKAASRFLTQATLGPTFAQIENLRTQGMEAWLDAQLNMPSQFSNLAYVNQLRKNIFDSLHLQDPVQYATINDVFLGDQYFNVAWFQGMMTASDVLRWRVSLALSQIFVTSRVGVLDDNPYVLARYYDLLQNNAFGTYRSLLDSVTFSPAMALYLTYMNNHATDVADGRQVFPDENYAREVMQLFSIGLFELNPDGTEKKDANNQPIPTYTNTDIAGLAKVFTGLSWANARYIGERDNNYWDYTKKLKMFALDSSDAKRNTWKTNPRIVNAHEPGAKTFLGHTISASRTAADGLIDISDALDVLSNHPNVGPFISRRLIQHLVTSNPSPAFIGRTSAVFANNGSGIRGDLKALIKAILLDPEARDCCSDSVNAGHLREPILRYTNLTKGLELNSATGIFRNVMVDVYNRIGQIPLTSPSVFNFYSPSYMPDGPLLTAKKVGPEFQTLNSLSFANYVNAVHNWLISNNPVEYWGFFNNEKYKPEQDPSFSLTSQLPMAANNRLREFLDKYNLILAQGRISAARMSQIEATTKALPISYNASGVINTDQADRRLRFGLFLILVAPEYLIAK